MDELACEIWDDLSDEAKERTSVDNVKDVLEALSEWDDVMEMVRSAYYGG